MFLKSWLISALPFIGVARSSRTERVNYAGIDGNGGKLAETIGVVRESGLGPATVDLGTAGDFVILAAAGITATGVTSVTGDIGVSPIASTAMTGFALALHSSGTFSTSIIVDGKVYAASYVAPTPAKMTVAIGHMGIAYENAAGRTGPDYTNHYAGVLTGAGADPNVKPALAPGLYKFTTDVIFTDDVIFHGSSTDIWILQIFVDLNVGAGASVILTGGALPENIFWQVSGKTIVAAGANVQGIVLCKTSITFAVGTSLIGRALSQTLVTMSSTTVEAPPIILPTNAPTSEFGKELIRDGIRFSSKIRFPDDVYNDNYDQISSVFPLGPENYPLNRSLNELLRQSYCVSTVVHGDYECTQNVEAIVGIVGAPTHAPEPEFWGEFDEVVDMQLIRRANGEGLLKDVLPWFPSPVLWDGFTLNDAAEAVRNEYPGYWQSKLLVQLLGEGITIDNDLIPKRSTVQFLHGPIMFADLNTWGISTVGPINFGAKYHAGRARPEEVAWAIVNGRFRLEDVPSSIQTKVLDMNLERPEVFTAYEEGSPMHPSWPAMHSAQSSMSLWLAVVADLTDAQWEETKLLDLAVAQARTLAGVHYSTDNIGGLNLGQEVVAKALPKYLGEKYGADPIKVQAKIESIRFRWETEAARLMDQQGIAKHLRKYQNN